MVLVVVMVDDDGVVVVVVVTGGGTSESSVEGNGKGGDVLDEVDVVVVVLVVLLGPVVLGFVAGNGATGRGPGTGIGRQNGSPHAMPRPSPGWEHGSWSRVCDVVAVPIVAVTVIGLASLATANRILRWSPGASGRVLVHVVVAPEVQPRKLGKGQARLSIVTVAGFVL